MNPVNARIGRWIRWADGRLIAMPAGIATMITTRVDSPVSTRCSPSRSPSELALITEASTSSRPWEAA